MQYPNNEKYHQRRPTATSQVWETYCLEVSEQLVVQNMGQEQQSLLKY